MKIRIWHIVVFVIALAVFAVAFAPASFFVRQQPGVLNYTTASGTIWNGRLETVELGPYAARTASWRLALFDVLQGKAIVPVTFEDGSIEGRLVLLGNVQGDRRIAADLRLEGITVGTIRADGETIVRGLDILFEDGACARAVGQVETDALVRAGAALNWAGPPLAGEASCDGDTARILLNGANAAGERVILNVTLIGDGNASWRMSVPGATQNTQAALTAAGFTPGVGDGVIGYSEDFRWLP